MGDNRYKPYYGLDDRSPDKRGYYEPRSAAEQLMIDMGFVAERDIDRINREDEKDYE